MRKYRFDELPQLWNVLRGQMSLIGPRPEQVPFVEQFTEEIPMYSMRHDVRPGITGWAQVHQGYAASGDETREKLRYDLFYLKNCSAILDLRIAARTIRTILTRLEPSNRVSAHRRPGTSSLRPLRDDGHVTMTRDSAAGVVWRLAPFVAWIDTDADTIAFVDLREGSDLLPRLVPAPASTLWRVVGDEQGARGERLVEAAVEAGLDEAEAYVEYLVAQLSEAGVLVREAVS